MMKFQQKMSYIFLFFSFVNEKIFNLSVKIDGKKYISNKNFKMKLTGIEKEVDCT